MGNWLCPSADGKIQFPRRWTNPRKLVPKGFLGKNKWKVQRNKDKNGDNLSERGEWVDRDQRRGGGSIDCLPGSSRPKKGQSMGRITSAFGDQGQLVGFFKFYYH